MGQSGIAKILVNPFLKIKNAKGTRKEREKNAKEMRKERERNAKGKRKESERNAKGHDRNETVMEHRFSNRNGKEIVKKERKRNALMIITRKVKVVLCTYVSYF